MAPVTNQMIRSAIEAALGTKLGSVVRLPGGRNNVVARVHTNDGPMLAKIYFTHPGDPRDRLGTEFKTLKFLWEAGLHCLPEPITLNRKFHVGIFRFIEGVKPAKEDIGPDDAFQLADLLIGMWKVRNRCGAEELPNASEANFSLRDYCDHLAARLAKVQAALGEDRTASPALEFVEEQARPGFDRVVAFVERRAPELGLDPSHELDWRWRTLSPADHGFHNALRLRDGRLIFLDFEYAGWDDPATMLANACLQPEVPLPIPSRKPFLQRVLGSLNNDPRLLFRLRLIYPMLSLKWSLIMLNEFLPVAGQRRSFAGEDAEKRRVIQLAKSKRQLQEALKAASERVFLDDLIDEPAAQHLPF